LKRERKKRDMREKTYLGGVNVSLGFCPSGERKRDKEERGERNEREEKRREDRERMRET
jgi:hypothetical protein